MFQKTSISIIATKKCGISYVGDKEIKRKLVDCEKFNYSLFVNKVGDTT